MKTPQLEWMMEHGESGKPFPKATPVAPSRTGAGGKSGSAAAEKAGGESRKDENSAPLRERNRDRAASPSEARKRPRGRSSRSPSGGRYRSADREARDGAKTGGAPVREWDRDKVRIRFRHIIFPLFNAIPLGAFELLIQIPYFTLWGPPSVYFR